MNPTIPQSVIDRAIDRDPSSAAAEYGAEFRTDLEPFISQEALEVVTAMGVLERPPIAGTNYNYLAFCDPSGASSDSMTFAIAHADGKVGILDAIRERRAPFSPKSVVEEFAALTPSTPAITWDGIEGRAHGKADTGLQALARSRAASRRG